WAPIPPSSCCCQAPNLPWAPCTRLLILAARPLICHGPLYRLLMLLPGPSVCQWVPVRPSHCCCLHRPQLLPMCHFQVSSHCCWFPFCHRVQVWPSLCRARHPAATETGALHTLVLAPCDCPNE
ncbi:unnamed protein product, partial [Staurois parvus]